MAEKKLTYYQKIDLVREYVWRVEESIQAKGAWEDWYKGVFDILVDYICTNAKQRDLDSYIEYNKKSIEHKEKKKD